MPRGCGKGGPWWADHFGGQGLRMTVPRQAILNILNNVNGHLSAEDVYLNVHKTYPNIGLTTVYRTLELLVNSGLLLKFDFGDGRSRYELVKDSQGQQCHHHLVCVKCKRVIDYEELIDKNERLLAKMEERLSQKYGFEIIAHKVQFCGICPECK